MSTGIPVEIPIPTADLSSSRHRNVRRILVRVSVPLAA